MSDVFPIIDDPSRVSFVIPAPVKLAIADAIIAFAGMEATVEELIWTLVDVAPHHGVKLTRMDTRRKFQLLEDLFVSEIFIEKKLSFKEMWKMLRELNDERNSVIHGIWAMVDKTDPYIFSHRFKAPKEIARAKHFPIEMLKQMEKECRFVGKALAEIRDSLRSSPPK